jgi:hypothetical protein
VRLNGRLTPVSKHVKSMRVDGYIFAEVAVALPDLTVNEVQQLLPDEDEGNVNLGLAVYRRAQLLLSMMVVSGNPNEWRNPFPFEFSVHVGFDKLKQTADWPQPKEDDGIRLLKGMIEAWKIRP